MTEKKDKYYWNSTIKIKDQKPIPKVSKKRAKQNRDYSKVRFEYLQQHPGCQIRQEGCTGKANQIHHKKGRIGNLLTNPEYFIATCANCHAWAEKNPKEAKKQNYSQSRLKKTK